MKILAIDTSSENCSLALMENGKILFDFNVNYGKQHSVILMPLIERIFEDSALKPSDMDAFAINKGPGSFTGLRIGLSVAKAMANALKKPLYSFDTFLSQSYPLKHRKGYILVLNDALRKTYYSKAFLCNENSLYGLEEIISPHVRTLEEIKNELMNIEGYKEEDLIITGDCFLKIKEELIEMFPDAEISDEVTSLVRAASLASLTYNSYLNDISPEEDSNPYYMRKPQAEREYEAKHGKIPVKEEITLQSHLPLKEN